MTLTEYPALSNLQNVTSSFGRPAIDNSTIENGHQALTNSNSTNSNSSTTSNASAYSISSHLMNENACPKLPKSFASQDPVGLATASKPSSLSDHQCLKPGLLKHPLLYPHTATSNAAQSNHLHSSPHSHPAHTHSPHAHSPHSPLSPLAHFSHQHLHHHLHHLQQHSNRGSTLAGRASAAELLNGAGIASANQPATHHQGLQFKPLCRTQNINSFSRLSDALHRKIEYTGSGSSLASSSTSGCVSASSSAHHFPLSPLSNSSICSPSSSPSSGPQTPQSGYVQSPLAQSFTADSGLCLSYRGIQQANNGSRNSADTSGDLSLPGKSEQRIVDAKIVDRKYDASCSSGGNNSGVNASSGDLKLINKNGGKRLDAGKKATSSLASAGARLIEQKTAAASFLNLPSRKKDTDDESLLSDYSKAELSSSSGGGNLGSISATSTTNLVSATAGNNANLHAAITSKPSLPGTSSSFFHYPNIYNPLKNSRSNTKNNKKLIRFFTVCAYVLCGE